MGSRLDNEVAYGKLQVETVSGKMWYWDTPAGQKRWQRRVKMLSSHINADMQVLEVGCGPGYFTQELAKTHAKITAIDISPDLLEVAQKKVNSSDVRFKVENAYDLTFADNSFDLVLGSSVLHHLELDEALKQFYRVLKPGGRIFFTEPNLLNPHIFLIMKVPFIRKLACIAPDEMAFLRWPLREKLRATGFQGIKIKSFDFLHPMTPKMMIPMVEKIGLWAERIPLVKEISGSLYIEAKKSQLN